MMSPSNESVLHAVSGDSTWSHINEYMRKAILSKTGDFDSNFPRIVQDNASATSRRPISNGINANHNKRKTKGKKSPQSIRERNHSRWDTDEDRSSVDFDSAYCSIKERWSNGITVSSGDGKQMDTRFASDGVMRHDLSKTLARDLNSRLYPDVRERGQRPLSTNSIHNPQHHLIRPERIPSNDCLSLNPHVHHSFQPIERESKKLNGGVNYRWEKASPKILSFGNDNKDTDISPIVSLKKSG